MIKAAIALSVITAGATALAGVAYLQANRFALTSHGSPAEENAPAVPRLETYLAPTPRTTPEPKIMLDEMVVEVKPPVVRPAMSRRPTKRRVPRPRALVPCSPWRKVGPTLTNKDGTARQRRVQMLCAPDDEVSRDFDPRGYRSPGQLGAIPSQP